MDNDILRLDTYPGFEQLPLPFSWRDLPRRRCEPGGYVSLSARALWTTALAGGREVRLTALHQYLTYAGVLAGLPITDEVRAWPMEGGVRLAEQLFHCEPSRIVILPPELMLSEVVASREGKREEVTVEFLPAVCSIGTFESMAPVADSEAQGSEVVAVWFQQAFGLPEPGHITRCIQAIAWDEFACDLQCW